MAASKATRTPPTDADRENTLAAGHAGALEDILYLVEARVMGLQFIPSDCLSPHQIGYLSELHRIRTMLERPQKGQSEMERALRKLINRVEALIGDTGRQPINAALDAADEARATLSRPRSRT